jgi:hypothetical protein
MSENIVVKITSDASSLKEMNQVLVETQKVSAGVVKEYENIQKATTKADASFKSLKTQIKEATTEATVLAQKFGENSVQANKAAQRVANLREEMSDFNDRVKALNPEAKFTAFNQVLGSTIGAVQGVTGAIQLFGGTSKEAEEIARKLQGALNLTMGINSVLSMGDALKNLRLLLTSTTVAQEALTAAEVEGTVAAKGFSAAISSNALGIAVVAIAAIAGYFYLTRDAAQEASDAIGELIENQLAKFSEFKKIQADNLALTKEQGASDVALLKLRLSQLGVEKEYTVRLFNRLKDTKYGYKLQQDINQLGRDELLIKEQLKNAIDAATVAELKRAQQVVDTANASRAALKAQFDQEFNDQTSAIDKALQVRIKADNLQFDNKHELIQADIVAEMAAVEEKIGIAKKFNKDSSELELELALLKKKLRKDEQLEEDEISQKRIKQLSDEFGILSAFGNSISTMNRQNTDARIEQLQKEKDTGIISEKQYQDKLRVIKIKAAKEEKEMAIFQATLSLAGAILNALNTKPASAVPFAVASASILGTLQLAAIISRPLPKFNQGKLPQFAGTYTGNDNQLAWVASEEAIIPARTTRAYYPTLSALYKKLISPDELNGFVRDRMSGKKQSDNVDISMLVSSMKGNKKVTLSNADYLANRIGQAIQNNYDPRKN